MKDFVITKKFDDLGRIVIPIEMRSLTGIEPICLGTINPQAFIRPLA